MHVYLDDNPFAVSDLASKTVREVAQEIRLTLQPQGRMLVGLSCDGRPVPPAELDEAMDRSVMCYERLDFQSAVPAVLAREVLGKAKELLAESSPLFEQAGQMLAAGQTPRAMELMGNCFSVWNQVQLSVGKAAELLGVDLSQLKVGDSNADVLLEEFADQLRQVKDALENRDYVLLSDILQYELLQAAPRWQEMLSRLIEQAEGT